MYSLFILYEISFTLDSKIISFNDIPGELSKIDWIPFYKHAENRFAPIWDLFQNFLLFLPFGFIGFWVARKLRFVVITGFFLSISAEIIQLFIPSRHSTVTDILINLCGVVAGYYFAQWFAKNHEDKFRRYIHTISIQPQFRPFVLIVCVICLSTWIPFIPSLQTDWVWRHIRFVLHEPFVFVLIFHEELAVAIRYFLLATFVSSLLYTLFIPRHKLKAVVGAISLGVVLECSQIPLIGRVARLQDLIMVVFGSLLIFVFNGRLIKSIYIQITILVSAVIISGLLFALGPFELLSGNSFMKIVYQPGFGEEGIHFPFLSYFLLYIPLGLGFGIQRTIAKKTGLILTLTLSIVGIAITAIAKTLVLSSMLEIPDIAGGILGAYTGFIFSGHRYLK